MKKICFVIVCHLVLIFASCDPNDKQIFNTESVKLKAAINNQNEILRLGDTLTISLVVPDTVTSNTCSQLVRTMQYSEFGIYVDKIDTINRRRILQKPPSYWTTNGSVTSNLSFVLDADTRPYGIVIHFKPTEKGIYSLQVSSQPGDLRINDNYTARLYVGFDVANKHFNLLSLIAPYFGGQAFYDATVQADVEGTGAYYFRVE